MMDTVINKAFVNGEKAKIVPISRLQNVRHEVERFKQKQQLNGLQKWIVDDLYDFEIPNVEFSIKSIIIIAIPHPLYSTVELIYRGRRFTFLSLVMSEFNKTENLLKTELSSEKYQLIEAKNIPLKRLAVQSGFAEYGRNNIGYIEGMGSNFSFAAYYSDIPCNNEYWKDVTMASKCSKCHACLNNCPTGAILPDRFLIDNQRCLSYLNESAEPFPEWLPKSVHHCIYDCLKCQIICPMNKAHLKNIVGPIRFSEEETTILMSGIPYEECSASFQKKAKFLGLHQWPAGIAKNINVLIEISK